ncbi:hypothetical protein VUR80DRAFT_5056 [Thermomyces stellatus]
MTVALPICTRCTEQAVLLREFACCLKSVHVYCGHKRHAAAGHNTSLLSTWKSQLKGLTCSTGVSREHWTKQALRLVTACPRSATTGLACLSLAYPRAGNNGRMGKPDPGSERAQLCIFVATSPQLTYRPNIGTGAVKAGVLSIVHVALWRSHCD